MFLLFPVQSKACVIKSYIQLSSWKLFLSETKQP